jgi:hypothetical protein
MALFPLALLLLRFNRGRMPRARTAPMGCLVLALVLTPVVFAGNVAIDPSTAGCVVPPSHHKIPRDGLSYDDTTILIISSPQLLRRLPHRRARRLCSDAEPGTAAPGCVLGVRPVPRAEQDVGGRAGGGDCKAEEAACVYFGADR